MSLSQKHSGVVFVPWYNTTEWRYVYSLLWDENTKNLKEALDILKTWKFRTPLLSAGVEGTLILLEALLVDTEKLSATELTQVYALSLMRFLNICATNNDKQGTFYKSARKNDLSKWLIDMRHDIAHGHKLPSKTMLDLGLNQSLDWLKSKYWDVQNENIADYEVTDELTNLKVIEVLNVYIRLTLNLFSQVDMSEYNEPLFNKINYLVSKRSNKSTTDLHGMVGILEEIMKQSFAEPDNRSIGDEVAKLLVKDKVLLSTSWDILDDQHVIPRNFRDIWTNLLNILYDNGLLIHLLNRLLDFTSNSMMENVLRKIAALWIAEIFQGLLNSRNENENDNVVESNSDLKDYLEFSSSNHLPVGEAELFQDKVLNTSNDYTLIFLESVLKFNRNNENFIHETIGLVKKLTWRSFNNVSDELMFTSDSLEDFLGENIEWTRRAQETEVTVVSNALAPVNKWTRIADTSTYHGCPLGVLPHQNRNENPLITFK